MMSEIQPNADGTCSRECPQFSEVDDYCRAVKSAKMRTGSEICPIAYQRLLEVERHARRIRKARRGEPRSVVEWALDQALVAVRDLKGEDDE